jgi:hypothetical protein
VSLHRPHLALVVSRLADLDAALALAAAARARAIEVAMFFMSEAVGGIPARRAALDALADDHVDLCCCASSAAALDMDEASIGMVLGSQDDHAAMVDRADRVLAFT